MQHVQHEADALAQRDEADHHGQDNGQQANDLIKNTAEHISIHDSGQAGCSSGIASLKTLLLSQEIYGCGSLTRTGISGFRARYATITPTRDISEEHTEKLICKVAEQHNNEEDQIALDVTENSKGFGLKEGHALLNNDIIHRNSLN